jgi:hypothetical protein
MTDDDFLEHLRSVAAQVDPVPAAVLRDASAALTFRTVDAELAEMLTPDALVRGARPRLLAFESTQVTVNLEITDTSVRGLVTGAHGEAVVETPSSRTVVPIEDGWFVVTGVPSGLVRVRLTALDGTPVVTAWTRY